MPDTNAPLAACSKGCSVFWPESVGGGMRGGAGLIVPFDDPFIVGQEWKFTVAPDGAKVTPHDNLNAAREYARLGYTSVPYSEFGATQAASAPAPAPKAAAPAPKGKPPAAAAAETDDED